MSTSTVSITTATGQLSLRELHELVRDARGREAAVTAAFDQARAARKSAERALDVRTRVLANERRRLRSHLAHGITCAGEGGDRTWSCACGASGAVRPLAAA
ncbi:hypothetical protein [Microbacterium sp.]|uniref:hypothetical protein n=1 Tax=Microbacterium sp. TaxID=51671 RepID=UPI003F725E87